VIRIKQKRQTGLRHSHRVGRPDSLTPGRVWSRAFLGALGDQGVSNLPLDWPRAIKIHCPLADRMRTDPEGWKEPDPEIYATPTALAQQELPTPIAFTLPGGG
jgi:hypothetical protein